jgi:hypothetical protein
MNNGHRGSSNLSVFISTELNYAKYNLTEILLSSKEDHSKLHDEASRNNSVAV